MPAFRRHIGKTGIAITLVTREDAESIDNIQKLTGTKIAPMDGKAQPEAEPEAREEKPRRERRERREEKPAPKAQKPERAPRRERERERRPEPETEDGGWHGPVPSFLGKGFGD